MVIKKRVMYEWNRLNNQVVSAKSLGNLERLDRSYMDGEDR